MATERWSNEIEKKQVLVSQKGTKAGGPVLHTVNKVPYVYADEGHTAFVGESGAGKTWCGIMPLIRSLIEAKESMVIVDPKGELYRNTACFIYDSYKKYVINLRDIINSISWNPLKMVADLYYSEDESDNNLAEEVLDELAHNLYPIGDKADPFWAQSARSLFIGLVHLLLDYAPADCINIYNVYNLLVSGEMRMGAGTYLKEMLKHIKRTSVASMLLQSYVSTAEDTKGGIRSVFLEGISMFARSSGLKKFSSFSDFDIGKLKGDEPVAIYVILPDESPIYDDLAGVLASQILNHYVKIAQKDYEGVLPVRMNIVLEELGNIGKSIDNLPHLMSAGRSRNIRVQLVLQSYSQLEDIYGKSKAETILSNAATTIAFRTSNYETLKMLSLKCGDRYVEVDGRLDKVPLITPTELGAMETGQALIIIKGRVKYIEKLNGYNKVFDCGRLFATPVPKAPEHFDIKMFDIFETVKKMMKESNSEKNNLKAVSGSSNNWDNFSPSAGNIAGEKSIDELIASIDRQIARLEQEEAEQKKNAARSGKTDKPGETEKAGKIGKVERTDKKENKKPGQDSE